MAQMRLKRYDNNNDFYIMKNGRPNEGVSYNLYSAKTPTQDDRAIYFKELNFVNILTVRLDNIKTFKNLSKYKYVKFEFAVLLNSSFNICSSYNKLIYSKTYKHSDLEWNFYKLVFSRDQWEIIENITNQFRTTGSNSSHGMAFANIILSTNNKY